MFAGPFISGTFFFFSELSFITSSFGCCADRVGSCADSVSNCARVVEIRMTFLADSSLPLSTQKEILFFLVGGLILSISLNTSWRFSTSKRFVAASHLLILRWKYLRKSSFFSTPIRNKNLSYLNYVCTVEIQLTAWLYMQSFYSVSYAVDNAFLNCLFWIWL